MKNPEAKTYEGPKNYRKLVQNVPKLYSLSDKQLQENNPFDKKTIMTESFSGENTPTKHYLAKSIQSRGKLELRQINEIASRSLKIWQTSKKRLETVAPASPSMSSASTRKTTAIESRNQSQSQSVDYWDTKRSSKSFNLSWQTREARLWNGGSGTFGALYTSKNHAKLAKKSSAHFQLTPSHKLFLPQKPSRG